MKKTIITFILGAAVATLIAIVLNKSNSNKEQDSKPIWSSKIVYSTENTEGYWFPTHASLLIVDRAYTEKLETFFVDIASGKSTHRHIHSDTEQLYYILRGAGYTTMERNGVVEEHAFKEGDVVHIPRNSYHQTFCTSEIDLRYLCVDCFPNGKNPEEPTWDDHARVVCAQNGWNYQQCRQPNK